MATIGKVSAIFTANAGGLTSGVKDAGDAMGRLERDISGVKSGISTLVAIDVTRFFAQIVSSAVSVAKSFVDMGQAEAEVIDQTSKLAARLGMTYGELSGLALAGDLAGVSIDQLGVAATKADVQLVRAAGGSKNAQAAFSGIGLSIADLQQMSPAERFSAIADAIAQLPTPAQRAEAAVRLFGKAGAELLPLFNSGAGAISDATEEAQKFGLSLTNMQGQNVEAMNDAFTRAQSAIRGVIQQVVAYLAPAIQNVADTFTKLIGEIGGANIGQTIGRAILDAAQFMAKIVDQFVSNLATVWEYVSKVGGQWSDVVQVAQRVFSFFSGIVNTLEVAFGAIVIGLTGAAELVLKGGQSILGALGMEWPALDQAIAGLQGFNKSLGDGLTAKADEAAGDFNFALWGNPQEIEAAGEAIAGPFEGMVVDSIARAEEALKTVDEVTSRPFEVEEHVDVTVSVKDAVEGIESKSREGIKEMFRLMRDTMSDLQEETNKHLQKIAVNTEADEEVDVFELPPAAGVR